MTPTATVRTGSVDDLDGVMALSDAAIARLAEQGRTGQWGDQPWSASAGRVARVAWRGQLLERVRGPQEV